MVRIRGVIEERWLSSNVRLIGHFDPFNRHRDRTTNRLAGMRRENGARTAQCHGIGFSGVGSGTGGCGNAEIIWWTGAP